LVNELLARHAARDPRHRFTASRVDVEATLDAILRPRLALARRLLTRPTRRALIFQARLFFPCDIGYITQN
jgi:hypothetical protein